MKDKKKIVIGTLCALIMIMAVGYALLSQQLSINGTAKKYELKSSPNWVRGAYYTMTPNESNKIMHVAGSGEILSTLICNADYSDSEVRPVINLYKSAIE